LGTERAFFQGVKRADRLDAATRSLFGNREEVNRSGMRGVPQHATALRFGAASGKGEEKSGEDRKGGARRGRRLGLCVPVARKMHDESGSSVLSLFDAALRGRVSIRAKHLPGTFPPKTWPPLPYTRRLLQGPKTVSVKPKNCTKTSAGVSIGKCQDPHVIKSGFRFPGSPRNHRRRSRKPGKLWAARA